MAVQRNSRSKFNGVKIKIKCDINNLCIIKLMIAILDSAENLNDDACNAMHIVSLRVVQVKCP